MAGTFRPLKLTLGGEDGSDGRWGQGREAVRSPEWGGAPERGAADWIGHRRSGRRGRTRLADQDISGTQQRRDHGG